MESFPYPLWFLVPGAFLSLLTVVGNGLVAYLIISRKRLHNATNWIVFSLAIADFILGAGCLPAEILLTGKWLERHSVLSFMLAASALNLSLLTVDRYVFITRPLRYSTLLYSTDHQEGRSVDCCRVAGFLCAAPATVPHLFTERSSGFTCSIRIYRYHRVRDFANARFTVFGRTYFHDRSTPRATNERSNEAVAFQSTG